MAEAQRTREREPDPTIMRTYDRQIKYLTELRDRANWGQIVVKFDDLPWEQSRQGRSKYFICRESETKTALKDWLVTIQDIRTHSGKHRHQGGLVIYVIEGEGYTEVDGVIFEWEAGDLLILPIKPGGVEHRHYNKHPGQSCLWQAFIYRPFGDELGFYIEQKETSPDFK